MIACVGCREFLGMHHAHGMMWCADCLERVQEGDQWQERYRNMNPAECSRQPGAAAVAFLRMLSARAGLDGSQSNALPRNPKK